MVTALELRHGVTGSDCAVIKQERRDRRGGESGRSEERHVGGGPEGQRGMVSEVFASRALCGRQVRLPDMRAAHSTGKRVAILYTPQIVVLNKV